MDGASHQDGDDRPIDFAFLLLAAVFLSSLVVCNLIANKFVSLDLGVHVFEVSAGILPYPLTFLATDLLSELYGRRRANRVVWAGFAASLFALLAIWLGASLPALSFSPVDDATFNGVFANTWRVIGASMIAYLCAQFVDVRLFHFWKDLTKGKHLWLRNNASTVCSQLLDSALVVFVLFVGKQSGEEMLSLILSAWLFKTLVALADTPLFYLGTWWLKRSPSRPL
ncbi:MAG: queuosine precursor transporter [Planctomycetota bacterium]|nr:queuosine precursor transporter [Planctomycetota bacterium]MEC8253749.1 queuosine precursor transporter [Planctomycetota bacterium]MEC8651194.1 queuosine precursor transporter [Planctomycetota bacterium]